jgi:uncharacterized delta-60 repeat protein
MKRGLTVLGITFFGGTLGFLALGPANAQAGVQVDWVRNYSLANDPEFAFAHAVAVDGSGNVYVTGSSYGSNGLPDYATVKYSPAGVRLWVRRYNGPDDNWDAATGLALDAAGNVFVTGNSFGSNFFDYVTIKYSPSGTQEWVARYNDPSNGDDWPNALAVDAAGNVYVTGYSSGAGTFYDYATVKYDPSGVQQWVARYNGPGNTKDRAWDVAVDGAGNVYVTGDSGEGSVNLSDYVTVKYNASGAEQWNARYSNAYDYASALGVDASGNVYVTGYSYGAGTFYDYVTVKYNANGGQGWLDRYHGGVGDDLAYALATDAAGNVYVTGESTGSGTGSDYATIKYSPGGARLWVSLYDSPLPGFGTDRANAIAVDASGNVYVTGESDHPGTETDYATVKYSASGSEQWVARYNAPGNTFDHATALAVDASGNVHVTGRDAFLGGSIWATIKYSQTLRANDPETDSRR